MIDYLLECEAENRAEAEAKASKILNIEADKLNFETFNSGGLRRLFKSAPVVVRVMPKSKEIPQEIIIRGVVYTLVHKLGIQAQIEDITEKEDNLHINLDSQKSAFLIGKHGRTLDAIQFLVNLLVGKWMRNGKRIIIDIAGYRQKRQKSLEELAERIADKAVRKGKRITLNSMSPYERRLVHLFLEEDERVKTESIGNSVYKRIQIIPNDEQDGNRYGDDDDYYDEEDSGNRDDYNSNYDDSNYQDKDFNDQEQEQETDETKEDFNK